MFSARLPLYVWFAVLVLFIVGVIDAAVYAAPAPALPYKTFTEFQADVTNAAQGQCPEGMYYQLEAETKDGRIYAMWVALEGLGVVVAIFEKDQQTPSYVGVGTRIPDSVEIPELSWQPFNPGMRPCPAIYPPRA